MNDRTANPTPDIGWLMDAWHHEVPAARCVLLITLDGLVRSHSSALDRDSAERLGASLSGVLACGNAAGQEGGVGDVQQAIVQTDAGWMVAMPAAPGTMLAVIANSSANPEQVGNQMQTLINRLRDHLVSAPRTAALPGAS